jgi:tetratricopeptide (TPR) repeat protein
MYLARSDLTPAERHLRAAQQELGDIDGGDGRESLEVAHQLARLAHRRGSEDAVSQFRDLLQRQIRATGEISLSVAAVLQDLGTALPPGAREEREDLLKRSLALYRRLLPSSRPEIAEGLSALGTHHLDGGRLKEAESLLLEARTLLEAHPERGLDHPATLGALANLATAYNQGARFAEAEAATRAVLERQMRIFGPRSPSVANTLNNLAVMLANRGDPRDAAAHFSQALEILRGTLGREHWEVANTTRNLARALELQRRYAEALPLMREAYGAARRREGDVSARLTAVIRGQFGALLVRNGRRSDGLRELDSAYATLAAIFPQGHPHVADTALLLARAFTTAPSSPAEGARAESLTRRAIELREARFPKGHPRIAEAQCRLGLILIRSGRASEGIDLLRAFVPAFAGWGAADPADVEEARGALERASMEAATRP